MLIVLFRLFNGIVIYPLTITKCPYQVKDRQNVSREYKYHVVSVDKTNIPDGASVGNWYRYVIKKGKSKVEGIKCGSFISVTEHAKNVTEHINVRDAAFGRTTYYHVTRKRK